MTEQTVYRHAEAFMLMTYRSDDGTEEEVIWNSRDGVTPFVITLRSGKQATHTDWSKDRRVPDFRPPPRSRMFVDLTRDAARAYARAKAEHYFADPELGALARTNYGTAERMAKMLARCEPGTPDLIEVPDV